MPYPSTRFSAMDASQLELYERSWRLHLADVIRRTRPDVIHCHHLWLVASILREVAPTIPTVAHCHATGMRQMELCPHLAERVLAGCAGIERFAVLHQSHHQELCRRLGAPPSRVEVVGAGYREDLFHARGRAVAGPRRLLYTGKYSASKGLPCLLDAAEALWRRGLEFELHVAGTGTGPEADGLRTRMGSMPGLVAHGQVGQPDLAALMRQAAVAVLPSLYEGLPLVLVEAFACGCRLVSSALPGVVEQLAPALGAALELVDPPEMEAVDTPVASELPAFTHRLELAVERALAAPPLGDPAVTMADSLAPFTWSAVFDRVEAIWLELVGGVPTGAR